MEVGDIDNQTVSLKKRTWLLKDKTLPAREPSYL